MQVLAFRKFRSEIEKSIGYYGFFSVREVRDFIEAFQIPLTPATAESLRVLRQMHCVKFELLPPRLYEKLPHLINHVISGGQITHPLISGDPVIDV